MKKKRTKKTPQNNEVDEKKKSGVKKSVCPADEKKESLNLKKKHFPPVAGQNVKM